MANITIDPTTFAFLKKLSSNNDRDWFAAHKDNYEAAKQNVEQFVDALIEKMSVHDSIETPSAKKSLYRIYNDVRFSKDKTPYSARFAGYLKRTKPMFRGGYYYWIKPGGSRVACGFGFPNAEDLRRIRQDIDLNHDEWRKMLQLKSISKTFGEMQGDQVKTSPRGFQNDHPAIDLLRYKQFWFEHSYTDKEVLAGDFLKRVNADFKSIRPFFDYMSDILTTDANGEAL
jgi:uncharacterized protein (TIGR02453 family)